MKTETKLVYHTVLKVDWRRYPSLRYQRNCIESLGSPKPTLNVGCNCDPANLGEDFDVINLDMYDIDPVTGFTNKFVKNFVRGNIFDDSLYPIPDTKFKCIVLGEIIEHCTSSALFLLMNRCFDLLEDDGNIIITTPIDFRTIEQQRESHNTEYNENVDKCIISMFHVNRWFPRDMLDFIDNFNCSRHDGVSIRLLNLTYLQYEPPLQYGYGYLLEKVVDAR